MSWVSNPRTFNWVIIGLFLCAAMRWGYAGNWKQVAYWLAAAVLNAVTLPGKD